MNELNNKPQADWKADRKKDTDRAYKLINEVSANIKSNPIAFKKYLDIQSKFDKYSVGNAMLILAQMPSATKLKDYTAIQKEKGFLKPNAKEILILEPYKYTNKQTYDEVTKYNAKKKYDISHTTIKRDNEVPTYKDEDLVKAFLSDCPATIKMVNILESGEVGCKYDSNENVLYISSGMENSTAFHQISNALAHIELKDIEDSDGKEFKCNAISYMVCRKYAIDTPNYTFDSSTDIFYNMSEQEVRGELSMLKSSADNINVRVETYFNEISKDKEKNKNYER